MQILHRNSKILWQCQLVALYELWDFKISIFTKELAFSACIEKCWHIRSLILSINLHCWSVICQNHRLYYIYCLHRPCNFFVTLHWNTAKFIVNFLCYKKNFMYGSCHIRSVLIGVKYWNWSRTLDVYLLFVAGANSLKTKLQTCNLQTDQSII